MSSNLHPVLRTMMILPAVLFNPLSLTAAELPIPPLLESRIVESGVRSTNGSVASIPVRVYNLTAAEGETEFTDGRITRTLGYNGDYLGPTIRVRRGEDVLVRVTNHLEDSTTVHWHGADVPASSDGGPHQVIAPGTVWEAPFRVKQPAATLWYHPHVMGTTAEQVYMGLAGLLIIEDEISDSLDLPRDYGTDDIPLILQERRFDRNGRFQYQPAMPDVMHGYFGNEMLVNGAIAPEKTVPRGPVRLRLLNGSNSSLLRISFDGLDSFDMIASDGGFLTAPVALTQVILSPGERAEVILDFSDVTPETVMMKVQSNGGGSYDALTLRPHGPRLEKRPLPGSLAQIPDTPASSADRTRVFTLATGMGARMTINGKMMDMRRIDERLRLGDIEIWEIENRDGGGMMGGMMNQPHSFHVHAVQFRILSINGNKPPPELAGRKDTVLLWPGDRVRIIAAYDSYPGLYMYHCHLLEHEDHGMMGQFLIE